MSLSMIGMLCRECGAICTMTTYEDNEGLCNRCRFGGVPARVAYINGQEVVGDTDIRLLLLAHRSQEEPDPIRDAIQRATIDWFTAKEEPIYG